MSPVGIAIVGAGPWGLTLSNAFARLPQVRLRWICDLEENRRARASEAQPAARVTGNVEDALRDPDVAAVIVAVDPAGHHAVSVRALDAGKHLFVEKPLALSARGADEIHALAAQRGRVLAVGHVLLHNPAVRQARRIVRERRLGEPLTFVSERTTPAGARRPGSAWWALAPHDVSLALYLFDGVPDMVTAVGSHWGEGQEDNAATATLHFPGGRTAHIRVARFAATKRRDVMVAGAEATLVFDELAGAAHALRLSTPQGGPVAVASDQTDALRAQCLDFATRVAGGDTSGDNGAHAVDVVRVLEAGEQSMRQHGCPRAPGGRVVAGPDPSVAPVQASPSFEVA